MQTIAPVLAVIPDGLHEAVSAARHVLSLSPDGWFVDDAAAVTAIALAFAGSAQELAIAKRKKQATLDTAFDAKFDLAKFIRGGTATTVTAAQVGAFLAQITNNYRTLRASITSAADLAALNAINLNSGWPGNP